MSSFFCFRIRPRATVSIKTKQQPSNFQATFCSFHIFGIKAAFCGVVLAFSHKSLIFSMFSLLGLCRPLRQRLTCALSMSNFLARSALPVHDSLVFPFRHREAVKRVIDDEYY